MFGTNVTTIQVTSKMVHNYKVVDPVPYHIHTKVYVLSNFSNHILHCTTNTVYKLSVIGGQP